MQLYRATRPLLLLLETPRTVKASADNEVAVATPFSALWLGLLEPEEPAEFFVDAVL